MIVYYFLDENNPVNDYPEEESDSEISSVSDEGDMQRDSEVESKSNASGIAPSNTDNSSLTAMRNAWNTLAAVFFHPGRPITYQA